MDSKKPKVQVKVLDQQEALRRRGGGAPPQKKKRGSRKTKTKKKCGSAQLDVELRRFIDQMEGQPGDITATSANRKCSAVTGSARKIKDNAADWHNLMMRWEKLNDEGFSVAGNIVNMRLSRSQGDQLLLVDESSSPSSSSSALSQQTGGAELQDECCKLQDVIDKMVAVVTKMERLMTSQLGIQDLEEFHFGPEGRKFPLFHSWNTKLFEESSRVLLESFRQELKLKQLILEELAHTATSDLCMVYLSCWLHQPFTPPQTRLTLEALLLETGHRPL